MLKKKLLILLLWFMSAYVVAEDSWTINLKDADIRTFVEQVAEITGKTFVVDPTVKGRITVISNEKLGKKGIYEVFLSILDIHGYSAVQQDGIVKIVKQADVKSIGLDVDLKDLAKGQKIVTRVIFVQNRLATELVPILRPMVAKYGHLAAVSSANAIIISDTAYNIERIETIIKSLDILNSEEIEVVPLEEAWVGNIVGLLESLVPEEVAAANDKSAVSGRIRVVADERSNSIILKGEAAYRDRIKKLIKTLDKPTTQSASSKVIFLNNANATSMAELLTGFSGSVEQSQKGSSDSAQPITETAILANEDLNALVIRAEPFVLAELEGIINELDVPRAQVLIEAAIVEVSSSNAFELGIQLVSDYQELENGTPFVASQFGDGDSTISSIASNVSSTGLPTLTNGLNVAAYTPDLNLGAILKAIQTDSKANLLSTPSVMTLDNSEAYILVGQTVPFETTTQTTSNSTPYKTITREDVGTSLTVTPHVQNDGKVRMEIDQQTESVIDNSSSGTTDKQTNKRQITTSVIVQDQQTIVLGGLIQEDINISAQKVPFLGDIPGLGVLFRSKSSSVTKTNLLVFIRPTIVSEKVTEISDSKLRGLWEMRIGYDEDSNSPPSFEQLFSMPDQ
ncbi:type II secretion system secretin GspD [Gynuella sunshinyii]|uniref:Type II secretory pathway, component PulD n=1 Tax=Gynuella sunshinyii YC6258 TaxID=1445510 RepID=A0A0C5VT74_9GAMM|nr:type II secretion system secretin GspD [Gynuella sunshinyii]AJQ96528.1 type II secretory pathway, component PulD [Gynuella sunshinyii YC6258]